MRLVILLLLVLIGGCGVTAETPSRPIAMNCPSLLSEQELIINFSQEMLEEGKPHAALANLQRLADDNPEVRWRKARIMRLLGDASAVTLYQSLLGTCLEARGLHGLGQLDFAKGNYHRALDYFRKAVQLTPADDAVRNDMGLVYMHLRRLQDARFQLLTALELNQANPQPVDNLLTLLLYQDMQSEAKGLVKSQNLSPERLSLAEQRARGMLAADRR